MVIIAMSFIHQNSLVAQSASLVKANKLFALLAYSEAIPLYEKVLKHDTLNVEALVNLGECYRMTNNVPGQLTVYGKIVASGIGKPIHSFYYAQALMQCGNYAKATFYLAHYNADERGETFLKAINNLNKYFRDSACYSVKRMPFNSGQNDFSPVIWQGNKVVYTSSRIRNGAVNFTYPWTEQSFFHVYITSKKENGSYSRPHRFAPDLETRFNDGPVCFTHDEKRLYVTRNAVINNKALRADDGQVKLRLYRAAINGKGSGYSAMGEFEYNGAQFNVAHPAISADGKKLYFSSDMPGGFGGMDLYVCSAEGELWGNPKNLGERVNSKGNELFPTINGNECLYFSSNGREGIGGLDIFEIKVDTFGMPSGSAFNVGVPLNSSGDDFGLTFDSDNKSGYFTSNRFNPDGNDDIYAFTQLKTVKRTITIKGFAIDSLSRMVLPGATISIIMNAKDTLSSVITDEQGRFSFEAEYEKEYAILAEKDKYIGGSMVVSTSNTDAAEINTEVLLLAEPLITLTLLIVDAATQAPLSDVSLTIMDKSNGVVEHVNTSADGTFRRLLWDKKVGDSISLALSFSKDGYINRGSTFHYRIPRPGNIKTTELLNKFELGLDLAKVIQLNPIYFDLGKSNIRPDASLELDKVVQIMKENPTIVIELGSHTDCRGTAAANMSLSDKRAKASVAYIVSKGIEQTRISGKGYGESKPVNKCECEGGRIVPCTEQEHQRNRRTEFLIVKY